MKTARLILVCAAALSVFADTDPFVGVWKLNTNKSKFPPGAPDFFFATIKIESAGNGLKSTASAADGEGYSTSFTFSCQLNGIPCKVTTATSLRGASAVDAINLKRVDPNTIVATGTRNGKHVYSDRRVVSADGTTMTVTRDGTTPKGEKYESIIVLGRLH
jgi:hypothetical protein